MSKYMDKRDEKDCQAIGWLQAILSLREGRATNGNIYVLRIHIYTIYAAHIYAVGTAYNKKGMAYAIPKKFSKG